MNEKSEVTLPDELAAARAELRARQGLGARYDAPSAPARELDWARRGTAYFMRKLNELTDHDLWAPSLILGWTRRHIVASVGYQARALTRVTERARTGADLQMFTSRTQRESEITDGATLPAGALRHLVSHAGVHLDVEWRDLTEADWDKPLHLTDGPATARGTPWMRAKEVWLRAIELGNGGSFLDLPRDFLNALVKERIDCLNGMNPSLALSFSDGVQFPVSIAERTLDIPIAAVTTWLVRHNASRLRTEYRLPHLEACRRDPLKGGEDEESVL